MPKPLIFEPGLLSQAESALRECLSRLPSEDISIARSAPAQLDSRAELDLYVTFSSKERPYSLVVEVKPVGEPSVARQAIFQLYRTLQWLPHAAPIFMAPYISTRTARLCQEENVGYLDLAGNCHIELAGVYLHVEGKANPFARSRKLNSLYQPKAERVLRVLLACHPRTWRIQELADEARVSIGQAYKVKQLLLEKEWLTEAKDGIFLTKPAELLKDWRENYRFDKHKKTMFHALRDLDDIEKALTHYCEELQFPFAVTSFAAAARYAPYASYLRTSAFTGNDLPRLAQVSEMLGLEQVETGANVILLTPYDDGVFYGSREEQGVSVVSPIQAYLDLKGAGGRADEAAEHLLNTVILPQW
jgi:hypothetical protein